MHCYLQSLLRQLYSLLLNQKQTTSSEYGLSKTKQFLSCCSNFEHACPFQKHPLVHLAKSISFTQVHTSPRAGSQLVQAYRTKEYMAGHGQRVCDHWGAAGSRWHSHSKTLGHAVRRDLLQPASAGRRVPGPPPRRPPLPGAAHRPGPCRRRAPAGGGRDLPAAAEAIGL